MGSETGLRPDLMSLSKHLNGPKFSKDALSQRVVWADIDLGWLDQLIELAKAEDLAGGGLKNPPHQVGDPSTACLSNLSGLGSARLVAREPLVVCGTEAAARVIERYGAGSLKKPAASGSSAGRGAPLAHWEGPVPAILAAERVVLNLLQHLSGIATETRRWVDLLKTSQSRLLDTRKTHPGYRVLEKFAFACGGGHNHRLGLFDRVMLKDNHLAVAEKSGGGLLESAAAARERFPELPLEIEIDRLDQLGDAIRAGADVVLLDNFNTRDLRSAVRQAQGRCYTEASGGIRWENLSGLAGIGLDFISAGAPVHQAGWVDIGLDWEPV